MPTFHQSVDSDRPHTLLTEDTRHSGSLVFRYDDSGELITVPNIWYNQTYLARVSAVRFYAQRQREFADRMMRNPPFQHTQSAVDDIVRRIIQRAERIEAEADRMATEGRDSHPVAASRMQLDYGANVSV